MKEVNAEEAKQGAVVHVKNPNIDLNVLQADSNQRDGISMDVEGLEELDYVDDVVDEDLSDFEGDEFSNGTPGCPDKSTEPSLRVTGSTGNGKAVEADQLSSEIPCTSHAVQGNEPNNPKIGVTEHLTDDQLANLPRVRDLFNQFWAEKMKELNHEGEKATKSSMNFVKSPSDTTIYVPTLMRLPQCNHDKHQSRVEPQTCNLAGVESGSVVNEIISDFVDNVRIEQFQNKLQLQEKEKRKASISQEDGFKEARSKTERAVLEAEKFRANISAPDPGRNELQLINQVIPSIGTGVSDDDFFHLTCHIDPSLFHKIEKGEFVELEKLLPKDKVNYKGDES